MTSTPAPAPDELEAMLRPSASTANPDGMTADDVRLFVEQCLHEGVAGDTPVFALVSIHDGHRLTRLDAEDHT